TAYLVGFEKVCPGLLQKDKIRPLFLDEQPEIRLELGINAFLSIPVYDGYFRWQDLFLAGVLRYLGHPCGPA
ncbi:MAG: hypothetical protein PVH57_14330, partial [Syntrophobacterales bacterium]